MKKTNSHSKEDIGKLAEEAIRRGDLPRPKLALVICGWKAYDIEAFSGGTCLHLRERYTRGNEVFVTASL